MIDSGEKIVDSDTVNRLSYQKLKQLIAYIPSHSNQWRTVDRQGAIIYSPGVKI